MLYSNISDKLTKDTYLNEGKESKCYVVDGKVIKIFHKERKSQLPLMSKEGLKKLSKLNLKHFNIPVDFIYDEEENIVGYVEKMLDFKEVNFGNVDINYILNMLDEIKEDIVILSNNGYQIDDLFYNYSFDSDNGVTFFDLTSYKYIDAKNEYLKSFFLSKEYTNC